MKTLEDIKPFAVLLELQQKERLFREGMKLEMVNDYQKVKVEMGKKYARVDIRDSGRYVVDIETGEIFGVKGYGVVHRGHRFGTLDTIIEWDWSGYRATPLKSLVAA